MKQEVPCKLKTVFCEKEILAGEEKKLKRGLNIRVKNAGPTSSLLHQKSVFARNEAVHQLCIIWRC